MRGLNDSFLSVLLFTTVLGGVLMAAACPPKCTCTVGGFVNCSRLSLTEIPYDLPADTKVIDLSMNNISRIQADRISYLTKLTSLDLSNNQLTSGSIATDAFLHNPALSTLDVSYNSLTDMPKLPTCLVTLYFIQTGLEEMSEDSFVNATNLQILALSNNNLQRLHSGTFSKLFTLLDLRLDFNQFTDEGFPSSVFLPLIHLQVIYLRFNKLTRVPTGLPHFLKHLDLVGNQFTALPFKSFDDVKNLETLGIWQNHLREIEDGVFDGMSKLQILDANTNGLTKIRNGTLRGLTSLKTIYLSLNNITYIESGSFDSLKSLQALWLDFNPLVTMSQNLLSNATLPHLSTAFLAGSQWQCDCRLRWLRELEDTSSVLDSPHLMVCATPSNLKGKPFDELKPKDFVCKNG